MFDYAYALSGTLPSGLSFDERTRTLSGTPEAWGLFDVTYTAQDADLEQGASDTASQTFAITVPPRLTDMWHSDPDDGTYAIGDQIGMTLLLGSGGGSGLSVVGSPLPQLAVQVGDRERLASYVGATGPRSFQYHLSFRYTVQEGDWDADGVSIGANALRVNGATIATDRGVALSPEHDAMPFDGVHRVDGVRPVVSSATVNGDTLTLTFDEPLDGDSEPAGSAFTVKGIGADQTPTGVSVSGAEVRLTLGAGAVHVHRVTVDYEKPTGKALRDAQGNEAASFTGQVTNDTPDRPEPEVSGASVNGGTLTLTFDEALDTAAAPPASAFSVGGTDASTSVTGVGFKSGDATKVELTLSPAVEHGDAGIELSYTKGANPLKDGEGNEVADFTGHAVTNDTPDNAPTASDFSKTIHEDTTLTFAAADFSDGFSDPNGHTLKSVKIATLPDAAHGTLKVGTANATAGQTVLAASLGTISFEPVANWNGTASFTFKVIDSNDEESAAAATVTITVSAVDDLPTASNFSKSVAENTTLTFAATDFTGAFDDPDGHTLKSVKIVTLPAAAHGTLKVGTSNATTGQPVLAASLGTISFVPVTNWNGTASFTFKVIDSNDEESAAAATVTIAVGHRPKASDFSKTIDEDTTLTFAAADFSDGFSDPNGHTLKSVKIVTLPNSAHGTLKVGTSDATAGQTVVAASLGTLSFVPVTNWNGTASFTFKVIDSNDEESAAAATVSITVNAGVTVSVEAGSATEGSAVTFKAKLSAAVGSDVVLGWTTGDDDTAGARQATAGTDYTAVTNGSVTISASQTETSFSMSTTADTAVEGDETFKVTITGTTLPAGVTIGTASAIGTIKDDETPTASSFSKSTDEDTTLTFAQADFTGAFSDPDGHTLKSVKIVTLPDSAHGTLRGGDPLADLSASDTVAAADLGTIAFVPVADWNGTASFTFKVTGSDNEESAGAATVSITVSAVDDLPTASNFSKSVTENTTLTFAADGLHRRVRRRGRAHAEGGEDRHAAEQRARHAEGGRSAERRQRRRHRGGRQPRDDHVRAGDELDRYGQLHLQGHRLRRR